MRVWWMACLISSATFALAHLLAGGFAWSAWPVLRRRLAEAPASSRARAYFAWRTLPALFGIASGLVVGAAFLAFEPPHASESAGAILIGLAAAGAALLLVWGVRAAAGLAGSMRLAGVWEARGRLIELGGARMPVRVIECEFPVAAIVGFRRPGLVLSRDVVDRCSPEELRAIAAHESGHLAAGDNIRRLALRALADVLSVTRRGRAMVAAWHDAAEEAADDHAAASGARDLELASALVTVARLATVKAPSLWAAGVLFYRGSGIEHRVRRLIGRPAPRSPRPRRSAGWRLGTSSAALTLIMVGILTTDSGRSIHAAAEWLVQRLP